jgi:hypothetical protein
LRRAAHDLICGKPGRSEPMKKKRGKLRASLGGALWMLMSMFKVDPPPPPGLEHTTNRKEDDAAGAPPRPRAPKD